MKKEEEKVKYETTYCRKPLTFVLPALKESQAAKNPFKRPFKFSTMTKLKAEEIKTSSTMPTALKKFQSLTPTQEKRTRINLDKVVKPSLFTGDSIEGHDASFDEENHNKINNIVEDHKEEIKKSEAKKTEEKKQEAYPEYDFSLSKEVLFFFSELQKIEHISMDEVSKKYVLLPDIKGKLSNKTLLLDLDDTLVHTIDPTLNYSTIKIDKSELKAAMYVDPFQSSIVSIKVIIRPYALQFLKELSLLFEVVVLLYFYMGRSSLQDKRTTLKHCLTCWTLKETTSTTAFFAISVLARAAIL